MSRKKASPQASQDEVLRLRLEHLYIRRAALDQLIDTLQAYESMIQPPEPGSSVPPPPWLEPRHAR